MVVLPGIGKKETGNTIAVMHPTFRNMQLYLVIGIYAVTPYGETGLEILLGDVVISTCVI